MDALSSLADRIRAASAAGTPLRIRGGGTKDFYGERLEGELLSTQDLDGIVSYEPSELVVTVRAGTSLAALEAALAERGQCLPFEPPHFGAGATVGGMVASGLSGPARASVGSVRDYVLGLQLVNGRGEALVFGGQVMKNVAGYDVSRLMVGAMGTLGLITEVSLKVLPVAPAEATLRLRLPQEEALARLNTWGGQPLPLNASCWLEEEGQGTLYLRLRGARAAVDAACRSLGGERLDNAGAAPEWDRLREQRLPWFTAAAGQDLWRLSVPQTAPVLELPAVPLVEWHGAQRWVHAAAADAGRIRETALRAGGHATLFRTARTDASGRMTPLAPALAAIHERLKQQFDPAAVFNRGRLYPHF
ncbi:glycolate oxidase subunit GlcE [Ramlibacter ginsenosidimutans]|uniref:Glycolate oxidase subunit GlcE n=1 Tax=Ramlibacter ginsenosidimutans TaxID=502333 RepID=A0A934WLD5_9BURK|nr:glycolate oxidase subunit GlcE [Ramlibacter ginsenosidimutans]MBK6005510.1 glycolate oxidase subunit GlcE [Ramlibacter ginsenosidimutans]